MPPTRLKHHETFEMWRRRALAETARFIEWGLRNPEKVHRIPRHPVGVGGFSERLRNVFWFIALRNQEDPPEPPDEIDT